MPTTLTKTPLIMLMLLRMLHMPQGHAYAIVSVKQVDNFRLVRLRNPWATFEWQVRVKAWGAYPACMPARGQLGPLRPHLCMDSEQGGVCTQGGIPILLAGCLGRCKPALAAVPQGEGHGPAACTTLSQRAS